MNLTLTPATPYTFDEILAAVERTTGCPPTKLPCGCYLCICPCCGYRELIATPPGSVCDPNDRAHRRIVKRARS
jgi:hypothetical protein